MPQNRSGCQAVAPKVLVPMSRAIVRSWSIHLPRIAILNTSRFARPAGQTETITF